MHIIIYFIVGAACLSMMPGKETVQQQPHRNIAFINGNWFNSTGFSRFTMYSIDGIFQEEKPKTIDTTIDLSGSWIIPPLAEAHNHNLGTGVEEWDRKAIRKYLEDGILYVKIQGNLPIDDSTKKKFGINVRGGLDVSFAQGSFTAKGAHPIALIEKVLLPQGYYPGFTSQMLKDYRYYVIESVTDVEAKWEKVVRPKPDFIKLFLGRSNAYAQMKDDTTITNKGLDPALVPVIVDKAHNAKLRVSAHILDGYDFHVAVNSGVDEIAHMPRFSSNIPYDPIKIPDAELAARNGTVVVTTLAISLLQGRLVKEADLAEAKRLQVVELNLLKKKKVKIAFGSDDVNDSGIKEVFHIKSLGVFDNLELLRIWVELTPATIFPGRKIGKLTKNFEASFLALDGNPIEDFENIKKIRLKVKQGTIIP